MGFALTGCGGTATPSIPVGVDHVPPFTDDERVEVFQTSRGLDLLLAVDTSSSMASELEGFAALVPPLLDALDATADLRVGVITLDMADAEHQGRLVQTQGLRWVDGQTPDADVRLFELLDLQPDGSGTAQGRDAVFEALWVHDQAGGANDGFVRDGAALHVVVLSDGSDDSALGLAEFSDLFATLKPSPNDIGFSSVVTPPQGCPTGQFAGDDYLWLTAVTGGVPWDICDTEYGRFMEATVEYTGVLFDGRLPLTTLADPDSIVVTAPPIVLHSLEWTWDPQANAVLVDPTPGGPFVYEVRYRPL